MNKTIKYGFGLSDTECLEDELERLVVTENI